MIHYRHTLLAALAAMALTACDNGDPVFEDFDYQTAYFAHQVVGRTVTLGNNDEVDVTLDNQHKVQIQATMGGAYRNPNNIIIKVSVDDRLCDGLFFDASTGGNKVLPMPREYYTLASDKISIPAGKPRGGVDVQLTDAFFNDPKALEFNYVIPLVMTDAMGVDSILRGKPLVDNPDRMVGGNWSVQPRDYVLYAIRYVNPYQGSYLRRGTDAITKADGTKATAVRHAQYVENDEVVFTSTMGLNKTILPITVKKDDGNAVTFNLTLTFSADGTCSVTSDNADYEISGNGKFVSKGEKHSMGGKDRDGLYLDYKVRLKSHGDLEYATKDTLVLRSREVKMLYPTVTKK